SQSAFHMGIYYEPSIVYKLSSLARCYPEYRLNLYAALSKYAFKTGHIYWGYRFLGWSLHYLQDLTQPYHSTIAPGISTSTLVFYAALDFIGIQTPQSNLIQLVVDRHFSLENYAFYMFEGLVKTNKTSDMLEAIQDTSQDALYPKYDAHYPRDVVAKQSFDKANAINAAIMASLPHKYVMESKYIFYVTEQTPPNLFLLEERQSHAPSSELPDQLKGIFQAFGSHTRNFVNYVLNQTKKDTESP
ncbi:MAG: hypothetical protein ACHP6H_02955, partial [Legionellales bacterium]